MYFPGFLMFWLGIKVSFALFYANHPTCLFVDIYDLPLHFIAAPTLTTILLYQVIFSVMLVLADLILIDLERYRSQYINEMLRN